MLAGVVKFTAVCSDSEKFVRTIRQSRFGSLDGHDSGIAAVGVVHSLEESGVVSVGITSTIVSGDAWATSSTDTDR